MALLFATSSSVKWCFNILFLSLVHFKTYNTPFLLRSYFCLFINEYPNVSILNLKYSMESYQQLGGECWKSLHKDVKYFIEGIYHLRFLTFPLWCYVTCHAYIVMKIFFCAEQYSFNIKLWFIKWHWLPERKCGAPIQTYRKWFGI